MAAQVTVLDSRLRSLAVLIPALILVIWVASEAASEEFIVPIVATVAFVGLVVFSVFVQSVRFETAILNLLLVGYLVGNRGFAEVTVAKPLFPGEICMILVLTAMAARYVVTRELPDLSGTLARTIIVFLFVGGVRLALDFQVYQLDAVRDSAMVYYAIYFFFGRQMSITPESRRLTEKCLKFSFLALVPISIILRYAPDLLANAGPFAVLLFQKDDLLTIFAVAAAFIIYTQPQLYKKAWLRTGLILFYIAYIFNGIGRASLVGLVFGSFLLLLAGKKKFLAYPAIAVALGLTVLAGLAVGFGNSNTADLDAVTDKIYSIVDFSGTHEYASDIGDLKAGTNDFRRQLWQSFIDETNESAPIFGRGFGYDFVSRFLFGAIDPYGLRSAHNYYITLYGRMGIIGVLIFAVITYQIVAGGIRAALAVRHGKGDLAGLGYWAAAWAILMASIFGVVLEGPVGAIVFWLILGMAVRSTQNAAAEHQMSIEHEPSASDPDPLVHTGRPAAATLARFRS